MENQTMTMKWYIIRTQGNKERSVAEKIRKEIDLENKIGEVIVPMETTFHLKNNKKVKREKIIYPGYIFVETNSIGEMKYFLKGCNGATGFLTTRSGEIKPMRDKEVEKLFGTQQKLAEETETPFIVCEEVKIVDGPFSGMTGIIDIISEQKVTLSVLIFGRKTPLEVNLLQIDKIK